MNRRCELDENCLSFTSDMLLAWIILQLLVLIGSVEGCLLLAYEGQLELLRTVLSLLLHEDAPLDRIAREVAQLIALQRDENLAVREAASNVFLLLLLRCVRYSNGRH